MDRMASLTAFVRVIESGGFTAAARPQAVANDCQQPRPTARRQPRRRSVELSFSRARGLLEQRPPHVEQRRVASEMPLPPCNGLGSPPAHPKGPGLPGSGLGKYDCDVRVEWAPLYSSKLADSAGLCFLDPAIRGCCGHGVSPLNDCLTARQIAVIGRFPKLLVRRARLEKFSKEPGEDQRQTRRQRDQELWRGILAETAST